MKFLKQLTLFTILAVFSANSFACKNANGDETTNEDECVPEQQAQCGYDGLPACELQTVVVTAKKPTYCYCDVEAERDSGQSKAECIQQLKETRNAAGKGMTVPSWCEASAASLTQTPPPPEKEEVATVEPDVEEGGEAEFSIEQEPAKPEIVQYSGKKVPVCLQEIEKRHESDTVPVCDGYNFCRNGKITFTPPPKADATGKLVAQPKKTIKIKVYNLKTNSKIDFETVASCQKIFGDKFIKGFLKKADYTSSHFYAVVASQASNCGPNLAKDLKAGKIKNEEEAQRGYATCLKDYVVQSEGFGDSIFRGFQKCAAINEAAASVTEFQSAGKVGGDPFSCRAHDGYAFDYPSCKEFYAWYMGLMGAETGANLVNEAVKVNDNMKTQAQVSDQLAKGNGQNAAIDASRKAQLSAADAEKRKALIYTSKATAITAQLLRFTTPGNVESECKGENAACCAAFDGYFSGGATTSYFPNQNVKTIITKELIKAGGEAAKALLAAKMYKDQADMIKNIENNMRPPEDESQQGLMAYCVQNPQDTRCQTPGMRESLKGMNLTGAGYGGTNFGMNDAGAANEVDLGVENGAAGAIAGNKKPVGDIGTLNKSAAAAKDIFNAPAAVQGGTGAPATAGSGGGGAGVSASGNALSKDPGLQEEKKDNPINITKKTASYEGGAYSGGTYRGSSQKKAEDGASNPFASMFGKDKGRETASTPEIDQPASDLFTKISNRYGEVQKRKALMDVR